MDGVGRNEKEGEEHRGKKGEELERKDRTSIGYGL